MPRQHLRYFVWAVVEKDERICPDVELLRDLRDLFALRPPVDCPGGNVAFTLYHRLVVAEDLTDIFEIVLAAHSEEDALPPPM